MAVTIDPRPTVFGDRIVVTGSYTAAVAPVQIDLSSMMTSIDGIIVNPAAVNPTNISVTDDGDNTDTVTSVSLADVGTFSGTTITVNGVTGLGGNTAAGTFVAIGRR
jgi:hypothetical protein